MLGLHEWTYGQSYTCILVKPDGSLRQMDVYDGYRQGDTVVAEFYAVGDRIDIEKLQQELTDSGNDETTVASYGDNWYVFHAPGADVSAIDMCLRIFPSGVFNPTKSKLVTPTDVELYGHECLGGFIGNRHTRSIHLRSVSDEFRKAIGSLEGLRKQTQLVLLRKCVMPRLNHTMRNVDYRGVHEGYDTIRKCIISKIANLSNAPIRDRDIPLLFLPTTKGGMGLLDPVATSKHAFDASQSKSSWYIANLMRGVTTDSPLPPTQRQRMDEHHQATLTKFMKKLNHIGRLTLAENALPGAASWLSATPFASNMSHSDVSIANAIRGRTLQKRQDAVNNLPRAQLTQTVVNEFLRQGFRATLVDHNTNKTLSSDPFGLPTTVVDPMAISVTSFNVRQVKAPEPHPNANHNLRFYQKLINDKVVKLQKALFKRAYTGKVHYPFVFSPTGAPLGHSRKWIHELKHRAANQLIPTNLSETIAVYALKSLKFDDNRSVHAIESYSDATSLD